MSKEFQEKKKKARLKTAERTRAHVIKEQRHKFAGGMGSEETFEKARRFKTATPEQMEKAGLHPDVRKRILEERKKTEKKSIHDPKEPTPEQKLQQKTPEEQDKELLQGGVSSAEGLLMDIATAAVGGTAIKAGAVVGKKLAEKGIKKGVSKAQKLIEESKTINRIKSVYKVSEEQATKIYKAGGEIKPANLIDKAKNLYSAKGAMALFGTTLGIQVMTFWTSVDNVAGLASLDAYKLMDEAKWSDISPEEIQSEMDRINSTMEFARKAVIIAQYINPLTGWAIGKFYKGVIERTQESINFKFDSIGRTMESKTERR